MYGYIYSTDALTLLLPWQAPTVDLYESLSPLESSDLTSFTQQIASGMVPQMLADHMEVIYVYHLTQAQIVNMHYIKLGYNA